MHVHATAAGVLRVEQVAPFARVAVGQRVKQRQRQPGFFQQAGLALQQAQTARNNDDGEIAQLREDLEQVKKAKKAAKTSTAKQASRETLAYEPASAPLPASAPTPASVPTPGRSL